MTDEIDTKPLLCDGCGNNMHSAVDDSSTVGIRIVLPFNDAATSESFKEQVARVELIYGKLDFNFCYVCWIRSLGARPKNNDNLNFG